MSLTSFLRRSRDTAPASVESPEVAEIFRALARSPIVAEAIDAERDAEQAERGALVAEIAAIEANATQRATELSQQAAEARAEALERHRAWAEAEQKHASLARAIFSSVTATEAAIRRLQRRLEQSAPAAVTELQRDLEDAIERTMQERPPSGGGAVGSPLPVEVVGTFGPTPAGSAERFSGSEIPAPRPAMARPSRAPAKPAALPDDWYSIQQRRLAALRELREPARATAYAPDPNDAVARVRAEMARLSRLEG